ncbi:aspartate dehydrogenase domain-containing protein isoform X2 [Hemicordylus capensis]|uniref:aspartate dehydrogenase domain-containing protein isoform X2 n=1 Tax=Hemicordylus capensis TaxID=884348 RepID=UPI00230264CF|nr:aspartate dehydrogenase domain-containing protein isoform X2 [Hemicordylus capensis]
MGETALVPAFLVFFCLTFSPGQYLVQQLQKDGSQHGLELAFVWNRDASKLEGTVPAELQLGDLTDFLERRADIIVEVAHPCIAQDHGESFLKAADFMVGSPTALADFGTELKLREAARQAGHTLYIPSGALWGGQDIQRLHDGGMLQALTVTMVKHPDSFRLGGHLGELVQGAQQERKVLYYGPVRGLCPLAPNNVNTMAAACMAAPSLGFDGVKGCLVADPNLPDYHVVEIEATGPGGFSVSTRRKNPAACGAVTGAATFVAFWSSLLVCQGHGGRVYLC